MSLTLTVGGVSYTVQEAILASYPDSFFGRILKEEWRPELNAPLVIDRDGALFRHVIDFMTYKCMPRNKELKCLLDNETLVALLDEADYYQLLELAQDIKEALYFPEKAAFEYHKKFERIIDDYVGKYRIIHQESVMFDEKDSAVVEALQPFYVPSCIRGYCYPDDRETIYKSSTTNRLNVEELLADATPSHFGRNSETVFDRSVRDSLEIKAELLNERTLRRIAIKFQLDRMSHTMALEARPYKLVIYQEGGHFAAHRDTVRGDNHVGTAVYILKSKFTGGELLVHSGGETMMVNKPYEWIVMYGDCMHEIRPVLSGVRVTLVYDIYCTGQMNVAKGYLSRFSAEHDHALCIGRGITEQDKLALIAACGNENTPFCITLQHLYPQSQSTIEFLKGGDRILFETLCEHFDVQLVPIICSHSRLLFRDDEIDEYVLFEGISKFDHQKLQHYAGINNNKKMFPIYIPWKRLCEKHLIFRQEEVAHTGNEAQHEQRSYIVRGLFVTPRI